MPPRLLLPPTLLLFALLCVRVAPSGPPAAAEASCVPPRGLAADDDAQAAAFALASRGELRRAVPCFAAALLHEGGAHHSWLWTDYGRALQGAVRAEQRSAAVAAGCPDGTVGRLRGWAAELGEALAASHVARLLAGDDEASAAALKVQRRLQGGGLGRHEALRASCGLTAEQADSVVMDDAATAWLVGRLSSSPPLSLDAAIRLARGRCARAEHVTVAVGSTGPAAAVRDALLALKICGVARLRRVWPPSSLNAIATASRREFDSFRAERTAGNASSSGRKATTKGVERWRGRFEAQVRWGRPFDDPALTAQPRLLALLQAALGSARIEIDTFTQITSVGGADPQPWHADVGPLWTDGRAEAAGGFGAGQRPPHGFVAVVPLLNVTLGSGPTAFQPASHFLPPVDGASWWADRDDGASPTGILSDLTADVGDAVVFDLRLRHRGGRNLSPHPRPLLYMSYVLDWFQDPLNFAPAHSARFDELTRRQMKLFSRLDHRQHVAELRRAAARGGEAVGESSYAFEQHSLAL